MKRLLSLALASITVAVAQSVSAHTGEGINTGFASGFWHPILGWDHVAATFCFSINWARSTVNGMTQAKIFCV